MNIRQGFVGLQVTSDRIAICRSCDRRWWQLWKPKQRTEMLANVHYAIQSGDLIQLRVSGTNYLALVNDELVLRWPTHPSVLGGRTTTTGFHIG